MLSNGFVGLDQFGGGRSPLWRSTVFVMASARSEAIAVSARAG
jgi:hypothetical protein